MLALVDLGLSNLASVREAFRRVGADPRVVSRPQELEEARALILPGVGAFGLGSQRLRDTGLDRAIRHLALREGRPILGICLGMQLLADEGREYGRHPGLGLIPGQVVRLEPTQPGYRVPNIGWCDLHLRKREGLFAHTREGTSFYFVHSYYLACARQEDVAATITYSGQEVPVAVERGRVWGVQFHPEKSQDAGLTVLDRFLALVGEGAGE
jgi:glutamine amidotransferase